MVTDTKLIYAMQNWCKTFMKEGYDEKVLDFIIDVHLRLIERASWREDEKVSDLKELPFRVLYDGHINDEGLVTSMVGNFEYSDNIYGNINQLEGVYNEVRDTLWKKRILSHCYRTNMEYLDEEDIYIFIYCSGKIKIKNNNTMEELYKQIFKELDRKRVEDGKRIFGIEDVGSLVYQSYYDDADEHEEEIDRYAHIFWERFAEYLKSIDPDLEVLDDCTVGLTGWDA